jgi:hypothetical protein
MLDEDLKGLPVVIELKQDAASTGNFELFVKGDSSKMLHSKKGVSEIYHHDNDIFTLEYSLMITMYSLSSIPS